MKVSIFLTILFFYFNAYSYQFSDDETRDILRDVANDYAKNLPIQVDAGTILESLIAGEERNLIYRYKLTFMRADDPTLSIFIGRVTRKHVNNYCTNPELSFYRKEEVKLDHYFYDSLGNYLFRVRTSNSKC
jgi:hypothetical protein